MRYVINITSSKLQVNHTCAVFTGMAYFRLLFLLTYRGEVADGGGRGAGKYVAKTTYYLKWVAFWIIHLVHHEPIQKMLAANKSTK